MKQLSKNDLDCVSLQYLSNYSLDRKCLNTHYRNPLLAQIRGHVFERGAVLNKGRIHHSFSSKLKEFLYSFVSHRSTINQEKKPKMSCEIRITLQLLCVDQTCLEA